LDGTGISLTEDAAENGKLTDCFYEKKDWRFCKAEASSPASPITNIKSDAHPEFIKFRQLLTDDETRWQHFRSVGREITMTSVR